MRHQDTQGTAVRPSLALRFKAWWTAEFGKGLGAALLIWNGYWLGVTAVQWHAASLPGITPAQIGLVYFIQLAPMLFFTPLVGSFVDRVGGRPVILAVGLFLALTSGAGMLLDLAGLLNFPITALLAAGLGLCMALGSPALHAFVPTTVEAAGLGPAVRAISLSQNLARLLGPMLAGVLLLRFGVSWAVGVVVVFGIGGALLLSGRRRPVNRAAGAPPATAAAERGFAAVFSGFRIVRSIPEVRHALILVLLNSVLNLSYASMLPALATQTLYTDEAGFAVLLAAGGLGGLMGAAFPLVRMKTLRNISVLFAASAAGLVLLALSGTLVLALCASFLLAAIGLMSATSLNLYVQQHIEDPFRGRVMSLFSWAWGGFLPIGGLLLGLAAGQFSVRTALITAAVLLTAAACANWFSSRAQPSRRQRDEPPAGGVARARRG